MTNVEKSSIFASMFHRNFMFFPNALPETIFRGAMCQPMLKSAILDRFSIFLGSKTDPWNDIFGQRGAKGRSPPLDLERPGADLGAIWRRKRSKDALSSILGHFLVDFGWMLIIFEGLLMLLFRISSPFMTLMVLQFWHLFK